MGPVYHGTHLKNIFCNNNRLPADPAMRTEVIKPIIKAVVTDAFHFTYNLVANIEFLLQINR
jgi:hypothetical protein